jgi:hypothetical protein
MTWDGRERRQGGDRRAGWRGGRRASDRARLAVILGATLCLPTLARAQNPCTDPTDPTVVLDPTTLYATLPDHGTVDPATGQNVVTDYQAAYFVAQTGALAQGPSTIQPGSFALVAGTVDCYRVALPVPVPTVGETQPLYGQLQARGPGGVSAWSGASNLFGKTPTPTAVDCVVSDWSAWTATSAWSACVTGTQSRSEERTRTILTPPANGGAACPALLETRTATQSCSDPVDTTAPVVTTPTAVRSGKSSNYTVTVRATDDTAIARVEVWIDGMLRATLTAPSSAPDLYAAKVTLAPGTHLVEVFAFDAAGNRGGATTTVTR